MINPNEVIGGGTPDSLLVLQRSLARRFEIDMGTDHGLGMVIPLSFEATINGRVFDNSMITLTRGKTPSVAVEHIQTRT
jgi:AraC family ethanolamine operon transcriptional activator